MTKKFIKQLTDELEAKGVITISRRVSRQYFLERLYGNATDGKEVTQ
ncbi:MAG: hypothetical protein K2J39_13035 [Ruminococcus sp.]|nr:hypothetical protein [Ruminococcus sp.]